MALSKKSLTWIFVVSILLIVAAIVIYLFRCDIFKNLGTCVPDPNKTNIPVPQGSPTPKWIAEVAPYNVGMFGPKIKALQTALGISADGKFGSQTKAAITSKGYAVPLSISDYNTIINTQGGSAVQNIPGAYAKYNDTVVRTKNLIEVRKAKKDEWLGIITGSDNSGTYWEIDGQYYVIKSSVYIKA